MSGSVASQLHGCKLASIALPQAANRLKSSIPITWSNGHVLRRRYRSCMDIVVDTLQRVECRIHLDVVRIHFDVDEGRVQPVFRVIHIQFIPRA